MHFIEMFKLVLSIFPLLIQAVKTLEAAVPQTGKGAEKLEALRSVLEVSYENSNKAYGAFEAVWPTLKSVAENIVKLFNSTGLFKKSGE